MVALLLTTTAISAPPSNMLNGGFFTHRGDTAILGYDVVAYCADGEPVKGDDAYVIEWMGAKWKFASPAHRDLFMAEPGKHATIGLGLPTNRQRGSNTYANRQTPR